MKILIYLEPWVEKGRPYWKDAWIPIFSNIVDALCEYAIEDVQIQFVIGDAQKESAQLLFRDSVHVSVIYQHELREIFPRPEDAQTAWFGNTYRESEMDAMQSLVAAKIGDFKPDLIWSFVSPVPFLAEMFPDTALVYQELGMLGRRPFPVSWYLDPLGTFSNSLLGRHKDELADLTLSTKENRLLTKLRQAYRPFIDRAQPFSRKELDPNSEFDYLVLLPLQYSNYFIFDSMCGYKSQFEFLTDVLEKVPRNIGVVVTQHINPIAEHVIDHRTSLYLEATYPNFIYQKKFEDYDQASFLLLDVVDGVIGVSSTVAQQALFFDKPIFSEANSQLNVTAQNTSLEDLADFFNDYPFQSKDAIFYFLLTRYYIPEAEYFLNGAWLIKLLRGFIEAKKNGCLGLSLFKPIDEPEKLIDHLISSALPISGAKKQTQAVQKAPPPAQPLNVAAQIGRLNAEIEAIRSSTSWKVTRPLRVVGEQVKRLRSKYGR